MRKPFKIALVAAGAVLMVVVVAAALFLATFDPNAHKERIAALVMQSIGRELKIAGPITLRLVPHIGVGVSKLTLNEARGGEAFATLESASVSLRLLPLLRN